MTQQAAALHPIAYTIWYEYVAGINLDLNREIDQLRQSGHLLDEDATLALYNKYVTGKDDTAAQRVANGFQRVLKDMSESAAAARAQASHFGDSLQQWADGLTEQVDTPSMTTASGIINDTRQMQNAVTALERRLEESRREVGQLQEQVKQAREEALEDALTGLTNRRGFEASLSQCLVSATIQATGPSLLITDIDRFKRINDTYGHLFGDKVLQAVARILKANVKGKDTAARYGGEEFAVLLPDTPIAGAVALAECIRRTIAASKIRRSDTGQVFESVTVSIGVSCYRHGEPASEFIRRADAALYDAKNSGRDRVSVAPVD